MALKHRLAVLGYSAAFRNGIKPDYDTLGSSFVCFLFLSQTGSPVTQGGLRLTV